jgi:hypothetical protein
LETAKSVNFLTSFPTIFTTCSHHVCLNSTTLLVHTSTHPKLSASTNYPLTSLSFSGSFIFLAIEGGASQMQQRTLASTNRQLKPSQTNTNNNMNTLSSHPPNVTLSPAALQDVVEVRDRCVENIWDVTVSLNVLYRENWTR